jgi:hypothetical protein
MDLFATKKNTNVCIPDKTTFKNPKNYWKVRRKYKIYNF